MPTRYNTGNPIESSDVRDISDNAKNFDEFSLSADNTFTDRFGNERLTLSGAIYKTGFKPGSGDFNTGFTVMTRERDVAWYDPVSLNWYSYLGVIPTGGYPVAPGTNPVGDANWAPRTDQTLRDELEPVINSITNELDHATLIVTGISELQAVDITKVGFLVRVKNNYGVDHIRVLEVYSDGTGVLTVGGLHANLVVTEPRTIYASQLFIEANSNLTDVLFNKLPQKITAEGITQLVLDTGDISVTGTLPYVYQSVTFSGVGQLLVNTLDNVLQRFKSQKTDSKKYHGQYNLGGVFGSVSKAAILKKKEIRIVLLGDSISASADYDSFNTIPTGSRPSFGVDNYERNNSLGATLFNELCSVLPSDVRIRFYSRSIAGRAYADITTAWDAMSSLWAGREQATAGKPWRDCVLDLNPDLVIHSMGMNETPITYLRDFTANWQQYIETKLMAQSFDQAILTTPNPNFANAGASGDFRAFSLNASKFFVSTLQRHIARKYKYSLIDVAFNSYLKRYGFDPRSTNFTAVEKPLLFSDGSSSKLIAPATAETLFQSDTPLYQSASFYISSPVASNVAGFDFRFQFGDVLIQLADGKINVYPAGTLRVGGVVIAKEVDYVLPANTQTKFLITITPTSIYVYVNNVLVIAVHGEAMTSTLPVRANNNANTSAVSVYNMKYFGSQFARYGQDAVTHKDYYGDLDFTTNPNGGGINHPSSTMLAEIYLPPAREFFTELMKSSIDYSNILGGTIANGAAYVGRILPIQHNRVSVTDYASGFNLVVTIGSGGTTWTVNKNVSNLFDVYIDPFDLSVFLKNTTAGIYHLEFTGEWMVKRPTKLPAVMPRGTLLPDVP